MLLRLPTLASLLLVSVCMPLAAAEIQLSKPAAALLPIQNQAGHMSAGMALHQGVQRELELRLKLAEAERVRNVMRSLRIRSAADLSADILVPAQSALEVEWLVYLTLHDVDPREVPAMTASAQIFRAGNGELFWSGFVGKSGFNGLPWLGMGVTQNIPDLAREVAQLLAEAIEDALDSSASAAPQPSLDSAPIWALVPLAGLTPKEGTVSAATVTEAIRDVAQELSLQLVSPNRVSEVLRQQDEILWGQVPRGLREELVAEFGVGAILTGTVEVYEVVGSSSAPEPRVGLSLRLVDSATGNILWTGAIERSGFHKKGPFGAGRVSSRGELAKRLTRQLLLDLQRSTGL